MTRPKILVAGVGNIFLGDDAFGVEVVHRLSKRRLPKSVRVMDFGIRGFDLAYALLDGYDLTVLVDAVPRNGAPGTLYTLEPDVSELEKVDAQETEIEMHGMNLSSVFRLVKSLGGEFRRVVLVGCEPATLTDGEDGRMGLSAPVRASVDEAIAMIESVIGEALEQNDRGTQARREGGS